MAFDSFEIRRAAPGDAAAVSRVLRAAYADSLDYYYAPAVATAAYQSVAVANRALLSSTRYFVALDDQQVVACGGWDMQRRGASAAARAELCHVASDPAVAGRGAGRAIVEASIDAARAGGALEIDVLSTLGAEGFYARLGFEPAGYTHTMVGGHPFALVRLRRMI